jgi:hypothetical protein
LFNLKGYKKMKKKVLSLLLYLSMLLTIMQFSAAVALADTEENQAVIETTTTDIDPDSANPKEPGTSNTADEASPTETNPQSSQDPVLAYVPLDNRPVNVDRVFYEAEAAGFKVVMPRPVCHAPERTAAQRQRNTVWRQSKVNGLDSCHGSDHRLFCDFPRSAPLRRVGKFSSPN